MLCEAKLQNDLVSLYNLPVSVFSAAGNTGKG